ncbi:MAG TPA: accessory gene regulator B family protein [Candidatus Spyradocola merdavium]|nr:accessory gene regulator B family protein [Candidatus Spyradocola merdavium]
MQRIAIWLTEYFIRKGIVPEAEREVCEYGFAITICTIASTLGFLLLGLLLGQFLQRGPDRHLLHLSVLRRGAPRLHAPALLPDDVRRAPGRARLLAPPLPALGALRSSPSRSPCTSTSCICWRTRRR